MNGPRPAIAIIGMGCRLPGAATPGEFWDALEAGRDPFGTDLPADRFPGFAASSPPAAALLDDFDVDWRRLRIPPVQVERMHRMDRVALDTMAGALADAGLDGDDVGSRVRVFVGAGTLGADPLTDAAPRIRRHELAAPLNQALAELLPDRAAELSEQVDRRFDAEAPPIESDSMINSASIAAGRIANVFDLTGGHVAVDAGAVSALAALDQASAALAAGSCDYAVVAAVSPLIGPHPLLAFSQRGMLAAGRPRPFASDGDGTLLGEGCVAVVVCRAEAVGGRRAYAAVEGIASSRAADDDPAAGRHVVRAAERVLSRAEVEPGTVVAVESCANGVAELDRAEAAGLAAVYGERPVTSSVPHVGYLYGASGLVALMKAAMAFERGRWPGGESGDIRWRSSSRVAVSDAGPGPLAYHALVAPHAPTPARSASRGPAAEDRRIAIVGMGAVAAHAPDADTFWRNLLSGADSLGDLPASRWDVDRLMGPDARAILRTRLAATVDAPGFSAEAGPDDPAERLTLAVAGEALRDAGHEGRGWDPARVAVIFGQLSMRALESATRRPLLLAEHMDRARRELEAGGIESQQVDRVLERASELFDGRPEQLADAAFPSLSGLDCAARVAQAYGFDGGALCVDAACASSLAAVESAAQALWLGDADVALAGGVAFNLIPEYYIALSALGALSADGTPPFHVGSDGFVPGEGAGCVILRRLADARAAGEPVYAVICGIGSSSDGHGASVYAPNPAGQRRAVTRALAAAGTAPADIDFLEAHGTGTKLGDGVELGTYADVFDDRDPRHPLGLGAVKSQIGHLSSAGGALALVKVVRALHGRTIPPSAANGHARPELADGSVPMRLESRRRDWPAAARHPRRAGVSSFGIGGANVHVVLEEPEGAADGTPLAAPPGRLTAGRFSPELVPLSLRPRPRRVSLEGRHMLVDPDRGDSWRTIAERLERAGAHVTTLDGVATDSLDEAVSAAEARFGPVGGVIDLTTFGPGAGRAHAETAAFADLLRAHSSRAFGLLRRVYDGFESNRDGRPVYAAVTSLGGDLGLSGGDSGDVLGASLAGIAKGLKQELPWVEAKVLDFRPDEDAGVAAEALLREVEAGADELEIAYAERRYVVRMRSQALAGSHAAVSHGDVVLLTGGGRGVVFECARALAGLGARVIVCGRTEIGDDLPAWAGLDDEAFEAFRTEELTRRRAADPELTPARFAREFGRMARRREIHRNLELAERFGTPVAYEACDVTDAASVGALVERLRSEYGRLDGVVHGAMVEQSTILPRKSEELIERTIATKVLGLLNLIDATRDDSLSFFACFGSAAGRFGSEGQIDYSAANALMAATLAARSREELAGTRCVTIDWTAWEGVGAAVANPEITELLRATGVTWVRPEEGTYWFLGELLQGSAREVVVMDEEMLHHLPFLGSKSREGARRDGSADEFDDRGLPLLRGRWPLVDRVIERDGSSIQLERVIDVHSDRFVREHLLHDTPILPATFGAELVAEAAEASCPGFRVASIADFEIHHPVKLHRGEPFAVRAAATVVGHAGDKRAVDVETRSDLMLGDRTLAADRVHHRARLVLERDAQAPAPRTVTVPDPGLVAHARSAFHLAEQPIGLGPLYSRARWLQIWDDQVTGTVEPYDPADVTARTSLPLFRVDPLLLDCAFQIASNWDGYLRELASVPLSVASVTIGRRRAPQERARVHARVTRVADPDVHYDVVACAEDGEMLLDAKDLHLRRVGRLGAATGQPAVAEVG